MPPKKRSQNSNSDSSDSEIENSQGTPRSTPRKKIFKKSQPKKRMISMYANKGGVGKTTGVLNLAAFLAEFGAHVLLIDADGQSNLSRGLLEAKIMQEFPEVEVACKRRVVEHFLSGDFYSYSETSGKKLHLEYQPINKDKRNQLFREQDLSNTFLLYRRASSTKKVRWRLRGRNSQGTLIDMPFVHFNKAIKSKNRQEAILKAEELAISPKEHESLLALVGAQLEYFEPVIYNIYKKLIKCELKIANDYVAHNPDEDPADYFFLTKIDDSWRLYLRVYGVEKEIVFEYREEEAGEIGEIPGLADFFKLNCADHVPETLNESQQIWIKHLLRQYRLVNLLQACQPWIDSDVNFDDINLLAMRLSLVSLKNPHSKSDSGLLTLLPGGSLLSLEVNTPLSNAIQGLSNKSMSSYVSKLYGFNELLRKITEYARSDMSLLDLSPASDALNACAFMLSDYGLTTGNPEAYSDGAMRNLVDILLRWNTDFSNLYTSDASFAERAKCRSIANPPEIIGYFLQKVPTLSDEPHKVSRQIAEEIKNIFDNELVPLIRRPDINMYPKFGLVGFDDEGRSIVNKKPNAGIPRFIQELVKDQLVGEPIIWSNKCPPTVRSAFKRALLDTIGRAICHDDAFPELLVEQLEQASQEREKSQTIEDWAVEVKNYYKNLTLEQRVDAIKSEYYRLDFFDMILQLSFLRLSLNKVGANKTPSLDSTQDYIPSRGNARNVWILNPCKPKGFKKTIETELAHARACLKEQAEKLAYLIVPIFEPKLCHWICIRAEITTLHDGKQSSHSTKRQISFLIDDPRALIYVKVASKTKTGYEFNDNYTFVQDCIEVIFDELQFYFGQLFENVHWQFSNLGQVLYKCLNQQGGLQNDVDAAIIILSNIADYIKPSADNKLSSNKSFDNNAIEANIAVAIAKLHNAKRTFEINVIDKSDSKRVSHALNVEQKYEIGTIKPEPAAICSKRVTQKRQAFANLFARHLKKHQEDVKALYDRIASENQKVWSDICSYLAIQLGHIPDLYREDCMALFQIHRAIADFPSQFMTQARYLVFKKKQDGTKLTNFDYPEDKVFPHDEIRKTLQSALKKSLSHDSSESEDNDGQPDKAQTQLSSPTHQSVLKYHSADPELNFLADLPIKINNDLLKHLGIEESEFLGSLEKIFQDLDNPTNKVLWDLFDNESFTDFLAQENMIVAWKVINQQYLENNKYCKTYVAQMKKLKKTHAYCNSKNLEETQLKELYLEWQAQLAEDFSEELNTHVQSLKELCDKLDKTHTEARTWLSQNNQLVFDYFKFFFKDALCPINTLIEFFKSTNQFYVEIWKEYRSSLELTSTHQYPEPPWPEDTSDLKIIDLILSPASSDYRVTQRVSKENLLTTTPARRGAANLADKRSKRLAAQNDSVLSAASKRKILPVQKAPKSYSSLFTSHTLTARKQQEKNCSERLKNILDIGEKFFQLQYQKAIKRSQEDAGNNSAALLAGNATHYGLTVHDVLPDGSCFFHAVLDQLTIRHPEILSRLADERSEPITDKTLRELAINWLITALSNGTLQDTIPDNVDVNDLIEENPKAWAETYLIQAMGQALELTITLVNSDTLDPTVMHYGDNGAIYLGYQVEQHFVSLRGEPNEQLTTYVATHGTPEYQS